VRHSNCSARARIRWIAATIFFLDGRGAPCKKTRVMDDSNHEMADRVARLGNGKPIRAKHLRIMGGYLLFAATVFAGLNVYAWQHGELWTKPLVIAPAVLLLGLWLVLDARALAAGTRKSQKPILWACIAGGSAVGFAIIYALTGSLF
jgi:hypothetical protein